MYQNILGEPLNLEINYICFRDGWPKSLDQSVGNLIVLETIRY